MMTAIWLKIKSGVLVALAFLALLVGVWFGGRKSGTSLERLARREEELAREKAENVKQAETAKVVNDVKQEVDAMGDGRASDVLKSEWVRDEDDSDRK